MKSLKLSFGVIHMISNTIAEVIVDEGVEITEAMVNEYHNSLTANFTAPFSVLVNKLHSYSYTFEAQKIIGTLPEINRLAIVDRTDLQELATKVIASMHQDGTWKMKQFSNRDRALKWLQQLNELA